MLQKRKLLLIIILFLSIVGQFATEIYLPSMPAMAEYFKVGLNIIQLSITAYVIGFGFGSLVYGSLSDALGRRPVVIWSMCVGVIGSLICCFMTSPDSLFIGRFIQGLGLSGSAVVARSIIKDISPDQMSMSKLASVLGVAFAAVVACAPIIGGYIQFYAFWRLNFIVLLIISILVTGLCWFKLPETNKHRRAVSIKHIILDYVEVLTNKEFLLYNLLSTLTLGGIISYQVLSSYLLQIRVGLSPEKFGYTSMVITLALIVGGVLNSKVVARRGTETMIRLGCYIFILAGLIYVISGLFDWVNLWLILLPMVLFTIGASILYPNASAGAMTLFATQAGTAASVYAFFQMLGGGVCSGLISIIKTPNQLPLGLMFIGIGMLGVKLTRVLHNLVQQKTIVI